MSLTQQKKIEEEKPKTAVKSDNKTQIKAEAKPKVSKTNKTSSETKPVSIKKEAATDEKESKKPESESKKISLTQAEVKEQLSQNDKKWQDKMGQALN